MTEFKVLFLYTKKDKHNSEELKDYLRMKLGSHVKLNNILDVLGNQSTLEDELFQSKCIVLVYSKTCEDYLQEGYSEFRDDFVTFDGSIIKAFVQEDTVTNRIVVVYFNSEQPKDWIAKRLGTSRLFHLEGDCFDKVDPRLDEFVQTVKSLTKKQLK
ncbi:uncharacterized protein LOC110232816 [Exaiptasia diaphana]|uniref:Uncharacterized protein n=1 Tax=Exaiptasia diaphana TaxID=2652724 RepID=A0A913WT23_EXADI|nr:uncharacterized protein LOC110232816 [Exaiptasia diaphana]